MRRTVVLVLSFILIIGGAVVVYGTDYKDVDLKHWSYDAVTAMSDKAIVKGYPDGSFQPDNTVTYGEFIKMALIAATGEDPGNSVSENWALNYYNKALELKYFTEKDINKPLLNSKITRAHMALIISSILGDVEIDDYNEIQRGITDITYQTEYEYDITKAYAKGILTGYTDKTFRPDKTLSRAESAVVIHRLSDESKRALPGSKVKEEIQRPIEEVITNIDSFKNPGDGSINEDLAAAETYEIVTDGKKYGMSIKENRGTKWIEIPVTSADELGQIYLMKDGKIVELTALHPKSDHSEIAFYDSDITQIDYIVSLKVSKKAMLLITNPFKSVK